ncbi:MAG: immunity 49 family protein [Umezawaea sp.]
MHTVPRHSVDADFARTQSDSLRQAVENSLAHVEKRSDALGDALWQSVMRTQYRFAVDPHAAERDTRDSVVLTSQVSGAIFAVSTEPEGTVEYDVGGPVRLGALGPNRLSSPDNWLVAIWFAIAAQDEERIALLCSVTPYTMRASGSAVDDYVHSWIKVLQTFLRREPVPPELFKDVVDKTAPDALRYSSPEFVAHIAYPPIKMFYQLLRRDSEKFTDALVQALTLHRDYWSAEGRADRPDGFVALGPLAIALLARSSGLEVDVESEYLPGGLLSGEWVRRAEPGA